MSPARAERLILCNAPLVGGSMEVTPDQVKAIVDAAADAEFAGVSLWAFHHLAAVGAGVAPEEVKAWHDDRGLSVPVVESLIGWESGNEAEIEQMNMGTFDVATLYGAEAIAGVVMAPEIDQSAAAKGLAHLGKLGADRGLKISIEWLPWTGLPTLAAAWELIQAAGGDNIGLVVDTWHWLRQPGGPDFETLKQVPADRIHCVQLDDTTAAGTGGDDLMAESMTQRLLPGDGEVEFAPLLAALDEMGADPIWAPEVFNLDLLAKGPTEMAKQTAAATRKVLGL